MAHHLRHVAIIPDGNRRWATARGLPALVGHQRGLNRFRELAELALERQIEAFSFWGFSTENWKRTAAEVGHLMVIFEQIIQAEATHLIRLGARFRFSGRLADLPASLQRAIERAIEQSVGNQGTVINLCLSYGGRDELIRALQTLVAGGAEPAEITEAAISNALDTHDLPDLDLVIRTSGEQRLSGFMPWQTTYAELYFSPLMAPDFSRAELAAVFDWYAARARRFGA